MCATACIIVLGVFFCQTALPSPFAWTTCLWLEVCAENRYCLKLSGDVSHNYKRNSSRNRVNYQTINTFLCSVKKKNQGGEAIFKTGTDALKGFYIGELLNPLWLRKFVCALQEGGAERKNVQYWKVKIQYVTHWAHVSWKTCRVVDTWIKSWLLSYRKNLQIFSQISLQD